MNFFYCCLLKPCILSLKCYLLIEIISKFFWFSNKTLHNGYKHYIPQRPNKPIVHNINFQRSQRISIVHCIFTASNIILAAKQQSIYFLPLRIEHKWYTYTYSYRLHTVSLGLALVRDYEENQVQSLLFVAHRYVGAHLLWFLCILFVASFHYIARSQCGN